MQDPLSESAGGSASGNISAPGSGTVPTAASWKHPSAVLFHLLFRTAAVVVYLFGGWFSLQFVSHFVLVATLLALDFWTVKNVTGRILVGLRWWNQIDEDGNSKWVFEAKQHFTPDTAESRLFWWSLYIFVALWIIFSVFSVLSLSKFFLICLVGLSLNMSNVIGYTKCSRDAAKNVKEYATNYVATRLGQQIMSRMFSSDSNAPAQNSAASAASAPKGSTSSATSGQLPR